MQIFKWMPLKAEDQNSDSSPSESLVPKTNESINSDPVTSNNNATSNNINSDMSNHEANAESHKTTNGFGGDHNDATFTDTSHPRSNKSAATDQPEEAKLDTTTKSTAKNSNKHELELEGDQNDTEMKSSPPAKRVKTSTEVVTTNEPTKVDYTHDESMSTDPPQYNELRPVTLITPLTNTTSTSQPPKPAEVQNSHNVTDGRSREQHLDNSKSPKLPANIGQGGDNLEEDASFVSTGEDEMMDSELASNTKQFSYNNHHNVSISSYEGYGDETMELEDYTSIAMSVTDQIVSKVSNGQ